MNDPTPTLGRKPDLLIVDDDPLIRDTLDFVLSRDFNVSVADSRAQARSVLRQIGQPPQLALVDLGLPPSPHRPETKPFRGGLKSFQKPHQSIAAAIRKLCFNTRLVSSYA